MVTLIPHSFVYSILTIIAASPVSYNLWTRLVCLLKKFISREQKACFENCYLLQLIKQFFGTNKFVFFTTVIFRAIARARLVSKVLNARRTVKHCLRLSWSAAAAAVLPRESIYITIHFLSVYYNNNKIKCRCCWKICFLWFYFLYKLKLGPTKTRKFSSLIPLPSGVDIECLLATTKLFKSGAYLMNRVRQSCRRHRNKSIQHHQLAKNRREVIKTPFLNGEFHSRPEPNQIEK